MCSLRVALTHRCCIGVNIFVATPLHIASGWFNLTLVQVLYYVYMGLVEDYL